MKKLITLCAVFALVLPMAARMNYYPGTIHFKNGESVDYPAIAIPAPTAETITVATDAKHKNKEKLATEEIFSIALWDEKYPEKVGYLYPLVLPKGKGTVVRICLLEYANGWGAVLQAADSYFIDKEGKLYGLVISTNNAPPVIRHYLLRPDAEQAVLLFTNHTWNPRKAAAAQNFAENPAVVDGIMSGKLKTTDIKYILDAMVSETGKTEAQNDDDDDESETAQSGSSSSKKASSHRSSSIGLDNDYDMNRGIAVEYTNHFSPNQRIELAYERAIGFFVIGVHAGAMWDSKFDIKSVWKDNGYFDHYDTIAVCKPTIALGPRFGAQFPVQLGEYYIIPRVLVSPTLAPFSFLALARGDGAAMLMSLPLTVGADFAIPVSEYAFNIGINFGYDLSMYVDGTNNIQTRDNSNVARHKLADGNVVTLYGQGCAGVRVAFCW